MRVLLIGSRRPWRMERCIERALRRAGHETRLFDDRSTKRLIGRALTQRAVLRAARRFRPDFVFLSKCHGLELDTVADLVRDRANAMWYQDPQWYRDVARPDIAHIAAVGRLARVFFVSGFDAEWRALGLPARFLPSCADRDIVPAAPSATYDADVSFLGTGYDPDRAEFLMRLAEHVRVRVWGRGWEPWRGRLDWSGRAVEGREFSAVCSSARIVLGINPARAAGATTYQSDRAWVTMLGGGFYLGPGTPGMDRLLVDGQHCAWYTDFDSCLARARHYLAHPDERERVRAAGEAHVRARHTYDQRIEHLLGGHAYEVPA